MKRIGFLFLCAALWVAPLASAEDAPISRRDGFLMLWRSIARSVQDNREKQFSDVQEGDSGFTEITYAKYRGILDDDDERFYPDDPMKAEDALLWLLRTRSVDDLEELSKEHLSNLLARYPLGDFVEPGPAAEPPRVKNQTVTQEELVDLMVRLDAFLKDEVHEASLYAEKFHGKGTAFGETFDMNALTAAHRTFPWNTLVRVTNIENQKSVIVRINDRGPYVEGRDLDLSLAAFTTIADRSKGKINVRFERLGDAAIIGPCKMQPRYQQRLTRSVRFTRGVPHELALGETLFLAANKPFVVRGVTYPDGTSVKLQDFILKDERYTFKPSMPGTYRFRFSSVEGRKRMMTMRVSECATSAVDI